MKRILTYEKYILLESDMNKSSDVSQVVREIERNYDTFVGPVIIDTDTSLLAETRKWPVFMTSAKIEEEKTAACKYYIKVVIFGNVYELEIHFDVTYKGVQNYDNPNPDAFDKDREYRTAVSLEKLKIKRVAMRSDTLKFNETELLPDLKKNVYGLLLTILKPEFDMISDEELIIRQL